MCIRDRTIDVYYESLCLGCQMFIADSLTPALNASRLLDMVNINLYPFGNAKESQGDQGWNFSCQHGPYECYGNVLETCILNLASKRTALLIIACLEKGVKEGQGFDDTGPGCASSHGIDYALFKDCALSDKGNQYEHIIAQRTNALNPPHSYVPWIVVNGVYNPQYEEEVKEDLLKFACKHSSVLIPECTPIVKNYPKAKTVNPVSYTHLTLPTIYSV
eukprot:TRINITY_DN11259_c0_g1_i1.p1 TRINITY_DN11259_c0_g1~~TRINITY_DN11259_c0_g1_i1.p1  ORF type:complete len:239 (+),score=33.70 TRINITY_DN11259_c0_g1_i1:61-717(+)